MLWSREAHFAPELDRDWEKRKRSTARVFAATTGPPEVSRYEFLLLSLPFLSILLFISCKNLTVETTTAKLFMSYISATYLALNSQGDSALRLPFVVVVF